jgi:hypothetical protein
LDGIGVFQNGQDEGGDAAAFAVRGEANAFVLESFVKETETVAAQGGRSALGAI